MKKAILMLLAASLLTAGSAYAGDGTHRHRRNHHKKTGAARSLNSAPGTHSIVRVS
jgi:hypothetical protein